MKVFVFSKLHQFTNDLSWQQLTLVWHSEVSGIAFIEETPILIRLYFGTIQYWTDVRTQVFQLSNDSFISISKCFQNYNL